MRWLLHLHLRLSYSSELGAALAYRAHARNVRSPADQSAIRQIETDEREHREQLLAILSARGLRPWFPLEWLFWLIGSTVGLGCTVWGEWASAFGASLFEVNGISEYKRLATIARRVGDDELVLTMNEFAEHEREHQVYFSQLATSIWKGREAL